MAYHRKTKDVWGSGASTMERGSDWQRRNQEELADFANGTGFEVEF